MISKSLFRKTVLQYRKLLPSGVFQKRNADLIDHFLRFVDSKDIKNLHVFLPIKKNNEPDVRDILPELWKKGVRTVTSKTDFQKRIMRHYEIATNTEIRISEKGIPEPVDTLEVSADDLDAILVPLTVADKEGNRIGYGGGYYDQFLKETKAIKIGLSLSNPVDSIIQTDEWDIPLDYLITPFKTFNYG